MIYKLLAAHEWDAARLAGEYAGAAVDQADGFIHFSAEDQVIETARRHFAGATGLVMLTVDPARLGAALRWEASRDGALLPHLYAPLPVGAVVTALADAVATALAEAAALAPPPD